MNYLRKQSKAKSCRFCGEANLDWTEVGPGKYRLCNAEGELHDCRNFHEAQHYAGNGKSDNTLLRQLIAWSKRWGNSMPLEARDELDDILDTAGATSAASQPSSHGSTSPR